jgi:hypothetical protein
MVYANSIFINHSAAQTRHYKVRHRARDFRLHEHPLNEPANGASQVPVQRILPGRTAKSPTTRGLSGLFDSRQPIPAARSLRLCLDSPFPLLSYPTFIVTPHPRRELWGSMECKYFPEERDDNLLD